MGPKVSVRLDGNPGVATDAAHRNSRSRVQTRDPCRLQESAAYIPDDNPLTPEKIALGKQLFWDKRWSYNGTVACVSCHQPDHGWTDQQQFSTHANGKPTARRAPTIVNRVFGKQQLWTSKSRRSRTPTGPMRW